MPVIPVGACMIAETAQNAGHNVRLLDLMFEGDPLNTVQEELKRFKPDVVGFSIRNIDNNDMQYPSFYIKELLPLIDAVKRKTPANIILGGAAVSVMPEALLRYTGATLAVTGDGETVFIKLLERLSEGRSPKDLPGVSWIEEDIFKSNAQPLSTNNCHCWSPDFYRWINVKAYRERLTTVPLQTKLGCHFKCIYCTYRKIEGNQYRLSNPEEAVTTIISLASRGYRHIEFVDNVFNSPYDHALSICELLAQVKHGASLQSLELNPLFIDDTLITAMERAGFSGMGITVESASDSVLDGLGKGFTAEHVYKAAEVIKRHKIPCVWIFMMGGPNETRETVAETLQFAENYIRPHDVAFFGLGIRIYPGTELESLARQQGVLSLTPENMLEPVFYISPTIEYSRMQKQVKVSMNKHMNFINTDSIGFPILLPIHRFGYKLGLRPPLWKHTRSIRRSLRFLGMDV
ncbi:MAG: cobalamin-dependent protein [Thermodesulfovibrionales bacterium]|nr:cobalamin-dependent protein [Thermodesulfovibrionales bacterium]